MAVLGFESKSLFLNPALTMLTDVKMLTEIVKIVNVRFIGIFHILNRVQDY